MAVNPDIRLELERRYKSLTPKLRKAARYFQRNASMVAFHSLRESASAADVSPTTLNRLATEFGYPSYAEFREAFREPLRRPVDAYGERAASIVSGDQKRGSETSDESFALLSNIIVELKNSLPDGEIEKAGEIITSARRLFIAGFRALYSPAFYFFYLVRTFREEVVLIDGHAGCLIDEIGAIREGDVLLILSYEPYANDAVQAANYAKNKGAATVAITDTVLSPIAELSSMCLIVPTMGVSFYQSMVPTMALLETLAVRVLRKSGASAVQRMKEEFHRREEFGAYWRDEITDRKNSDSNQVSAKPARRAPRRAQ